MTCTRDTYISDWNSGRDALEAWNKCGCLVCVDAVSEFEVSSVDRRLGEFS